MVPGLLVLLGSVVAVWPELTEDDRYASWQASGRDTTPYVRSIGAWTAGVDVVAVRDTHAVARARQGGGKHWEVAPPAGRFCAGPAQFTEGWLALAYGVSGACDHMMLVYLPTGQVRWQRPLDVPGAAGSGAGGVVQVVGDLVLAARGGGVAAFAVDTGERKWGRTLVRASDGADRCAADDLAPDQGESLLLLRCPGVDHAVTAQRFRPSTGEVLAEHDLPGPDLPDVEADIVSSGAAPTVVHVGNRDSGSYRFLNESLVQTQEVPSGHGGLSAPDGPGRVAIGHGCLLAVTTPEAGQVNEVVAVYLATGEERWRVPVPGATAEGVVASDDRGVHVIASSTREEDVDRMLDERLVRLDADSGAVLAQTSTSVDNRPRTRGGPSMADYTYGWSNGRAYAVSSVYDGDSVDMFTIG
ncbi:hypothetical protein CNX65_20250 [Actinosynnema pretiosum]|uniref:Pyrrolo-quinoline quinone repeat domain-containing protein n=1 Tax=Actinosynnema pretiosum TaxID=42197 RepID=A0A290Z8L3_9PSEU|nr:hypothetical protein CNX65_20250 [Actinosynnema pretiosum]